MHQDERQLSQKEKETMSEYLIIQTTLLNIFVSFLDANVRPPQKLIDVILSFAVKNGFTQEGLADLKNEITKLPVKTITTEGIA
jgi:hypothetical protein